MDPTVPGQLHRCKYLVLFNRVTAFAPTFRKYALQPNLYGIIGGNITLLCQPEAAPQADKEWLKNGAPFTPSEDPQDRVSLLTNGNIHIRGLETSDQAEYECIATNEHGSDSTRGMLTVLRMFSFCFHYFCIFFLTFVLCSKYFK